MNKVSKHQWDRACKLVNKPVPEQPTEAQFAALARAFAIISRARFIPDIEALHPRVSAYKKATKQLHLAAMNIGRCNMVFDCDLQA